MRWLVLLVLCSSACSMPVIVEKSKRPAIDAATAVTLAYLVNPFAAGIGVFLVDLFQEVGEMSEALDVAEEDKEEFYNGLINQAKSPFEASLQAVRDLVMMVFWIIGGLVLLYLLKQVWSSKKAKRMLNELKDELGVSPEDK